jgi:hypothetical protein
MRRRIELKALLVVTAGSVVVALTGCGAASGGGSTGGGSTGGSETCAYQFVPSAAAPSGFQATTFQLVGSNASAECTLEVAYYNTPQADGTQNNVQSVTAVPSGPPVCTGTDDGFTVNSPVQTPIPNLQLQVNLWGGGAGSSIADTVCKDPLYYMTVHCSC